MFWDRVAGVYDLFVNVVNRKTHRALRRLIAELIDGMKNYTAEQIEAALRRAGFSEVSCHHHASKPWIAVIAKKAGSEG